MGDGSGMFIRHWIKARYRWVIVAAGGLLGCVAIGSMFSLPVLLLPIVQDTGWSRAGVSAAMTIGFLAMAIASMGWGTMSDRVGPRVIVVVGSFIVATCLALSARVHSLLEFQILFGVGVGSGCAAIFAPMMACVTNWFDTHRSLAVSLVSAGMGLAPMTMSPLVAWLLIATHDWRRSLLILAVIAVSLMLPVALMVRRPPAATREVAESQPGGIATVLRSPPFLVLFFTNFFCCATHSGPIIHTVSYAVTCGIPMTAAVSVYSLEGFAGMFGRVAFGVFGDRFGAGRVLVLGLLAQAFGALGYLFAGSLFGFYAAASVFGFIYAGVMPLYAVLARENFPARMMGTVIGGTAMAGSLGMATGPLAGGLIFDALGTYRWLYLGSCALGLGAFLISMTFKLVVNRSAIQQPVLANPLN
jgi:MFS family permease